MCGRPLNGVGSRLARPMTHGNARRLFNIASSSTLNSMRVSSHGMLYCEVIVVSLEIAVGVSEYLVYIAAGRETSEGECHSWEHTKESDRI